MVSSKTYNVDKWLHSSAAIALAAGFMGCSSLASAQVSPSQQSTASDEDEVVSTSEEADGDIIIVRGTRQQAQDFVSVKREDNNIVDSISESDLATLPAQNVAEVITRLPGLVSLPDLGVTNLDAPTTNEARFASVRGIRSDLNIATLNGLNLAIPNQAGRSNFFDFFPVNLASRVEAVKSFNASDDGNAIGGQINVVARNGFDYPNTLFTVTGSVGFDEFTNSIAGHQQPFEIGIVYARPINDQIAVSLSASWNRRDNILPSYDTVGRLFYPGEGQARAAFPSFNIPDPDSPLPGNGFETPLRGQLVSRSVQTDRYGFASKIDFALDDQSDAWILASHSVQDQFISTATNEFNQNLFCFGFLGCSTSVSNQTETTGTLTLSSANPANQFAVAETGQSKNVSTLTALQAGYTRDFGENVALEIKGSFSEATQRQSDNFNRFSIDSAIPTVISYDISSPRAPIFSAQDPGFLFDPANYELRRATDLGLDLKEELVDVTAELGYNVDQGDEGFGIKAGVRYKRSDREFDEFFQQFDFVNDTNPTLRLSDVISSSSGQALDIPGVNQNFATVFGDPSASRAAILPFLGQELGGGLFAGDGTNAVFLQATFNDLRNSYRLTETTYAGFGQVQYNSYNLHFNAGLRYEYTKNRGSGFAVDPDNGTSLDRSDELLRPITNRGSGGFWLPSAQLNYDVANDVKLRLAYSRSLGRPNFLDIAPQGNTIDLDLMMNLASINIANPDLEPRKSNNFDAALEWYIDGGAGILSAGFFYKDITDEIFVDTELNVPLDLEVPGTGTTQLFSTTITTTINANSASLYGFELNLVKDFSFIGSPFFDNVGIIANATFIGGDFDIEQDDGSIETIGFLPQQPTEIFNVGLYYTDDKLDVNFGYNHVGAYIVQFFSDTPEINVFQAATNTFSGKISYKFTDQIQAFVQGNNLFSEDNFILSGDPSRNSLRTQFAGQRVVTLGATFKF